MLRRTLLTIAVLLALPATATAATLNVTGPDGTSATVDLATVEPDVRGQRYGGEAVTGVSIGAALRSLEIGRFQVGSVTLTAGGRPVELAVDAAYGTQDDPTPPVLVTDGDALRLLDDADGEILRASDGTMGVVVTERGTRARSDGSTLTAVARPSRADVGERITFTVANPVPGTTYNWNFGPGERATGTTVTHRFTKAGDYRASVFDAASQGLTFGSVDVRVGDPEDADDDVGDGGAGGGGPSAGGGASTGGGASAGGGPSAGAGTGTAGGPIASPDAAGTLPPTPPAAGVPAPTPTPAASPTPTPTASPTPVEPAGERVEGELLDGAVSVARAVPVAQLASASGGQADGEGGGFRLPTGVWVAAGIVVLAWFGWGVDMLRARPRWS